MIHQILGRAGVAIVLAVAGIGSAEAQAGDPSGPPGAERYRLTLAALRKVMPALRDPAQAKCEEREEKRDPFAMTLAEMTAALERCEPIRAAVAKTGTSTREAATVLGAFMYAGRRITVEESAIALGKEAAALPPGPLRDNVALIRQNEAELRRLTRPPGRANGQKRRSSGRRRPTARHPDALAQAAEAMAAAAPKS